MYGGYVKWERGEREDGRDSLALQVSPHTPWPELEVVILVVSDQKKPVSSTAGMRDSVTTSSLLKVFENHPLLLFLLLFLLLLSPPSFSSSFFSASFTVSFSFSSSSSAYLESFHSIEQLR